MIIETCPKCGGILMNTEICTFPPIPAKDCPSCGWHWEGDMEPIEYVPFRENGGQTVKEYKLRVPDDTVGISITVFRQKKKKRLFSRSFNVESALETYILDLVDGEDGRHEEG